MKEDQEINPDELREFDGMEWGSIPNTPPQDAIDLNAPPYEDLVTPGLQERPFVRPGDWPRIYPDDYRDDEEPFDRFMELMEQEMAEGKWLDEEKENDSPITWGDVLSNSFKLGVFLGIALTVALGVLMGIASFVDLITSLLW